MKTRADDAPHGEGWDESVLVWNATVATIPTPAGQPDTTEDVGRGPGSKLRPDRDSQGS